MYTYIKKIIIMDTNCDVPNNIMAFFIVLIVAKIIEKIKK